MNEGPPRIAGCSGQLGLFQKTQPAGKMDGEWEAYLYGSGSASMMKMGGEMAVESYKQSLNSKF